MINLDGYGFYEKLTIVIRDLSEMVGLRKEQQQELLSTLVEKSDKEVIKILSMKAYSLFADKDPVNYEKSLNIIRNLNPEICPTITEMKEKVDAMYQNRVEGNMSLEENHKLVESSLVQVCDLMNNAGVDYYIVGALPCFLKTGQKLFRYHDDIDIMVNENDMEKVQDIVQQIGYMFQDDRFVSKERFENLRENPQPHTVLAQNPNNEFHLGFFCFRREQNGSITTREYSHRLNDSRVVTDVEERRLSVIGTELRYDKDFTTFNNTSFRCSTVESVYHLKQYTQRPKDITDTKKLEPYIDQEKLKLLRDNSSTYIKMEDVLESANQNDFCA